MSGSTRSRPSSNRNGLGSASRLSDSVTTRPLTSTRASNERLYLAVSEARKRQEENNVAIAFLNVAAAECTILQFKDSLNYSSTLHQIHLIHPSTIILFQMDESQPSKMMQAIGNQLRAIANISIVPRKSFNDKAGQEYIASYADKPVDLNSELDNDYYALTSISALFDYMASMNNGFTFLKKSIRFVVKALPGSMLIDYQSSRCLELISNLNDASSPQSLFGVMNYTLTKMGARLLRSSILQPLTNVEEIRNRQDSITELVQSVQLSKDVTEGLISFPDLENVISSLILIPKTKPKKFAEQSINKIILFKKILEQGLVLKNALIGCSSRLLLEISTVFAESHLQEMLDEIEKVIDPLTSYQKTAIGIRHQKAHAVRKGCNDFLDVARATYEESNSDVTDLVGEYTQMFQLPIKLQFTSGIGFYLTLSTDDFDALEQIPVEFINIVRKGKSIHFSTITLTCLNERINESLNEVYLKSETIVTDLLIYIHSNLSILYKMSESVALLDFLLSLSQLAASGQYVVPEFSDTLAVKGARHPIMDSFRGIDQIVVNDIYADLSIRLQFITGANMSGKSTYLNTVALLHIMAQMGSFVPAEYACFRIADKLLTRIGHDNHESARLSSFTNEMKETCFILDNITDSSLVIIDELGRGTSTSDGVAISIAVAEDLLQSKAFIFFSTHFNQVCQSLEPNPHAATLQMQVTQDEESNQTVFAYKISAPSGVLNHYGLDLAKQVGFPSSVLENAAALSEQLQKSWLQLQDNSEFASRKKNELLYKMAMELVLIDRSSTLSDQDLRKHLQTLQSSFQSALGLKEM